MTLPRIGITLGDPGGIGPEVALKALGSDSLPPADYTVFGPSAVIHHEAERLGLSSQLERFRIQDTSHSRDDSFVQGEPSAVEAMLDWLERGPRHARVDHLERHVEEPGDYADFGVRRGHLD